MTSSRQKKKDVYEHIMQNVLEFQEDDPIMMLAMNDLQYDNIDDLATMTQDEIMNLSYPEKDTEKSVPMKSKKKCFMSYGGETFKLPNSPLELLM